MDVMLCQIGWNTYYRYHKPIPSIHLFEFLLIRRTSKKVYSNETCALFFIKNKNFNYYTYKFSLQYRQDKKKIQELHIIFSFLQKWNENLVWKTREYHFIAP